VRELLRAHGDLAARGERVGRAVVVRVEGSAPLPPGSTLLVTEGGAFAGSVSGGCVEAAAIDAVIESMRTGIASVIRFGVADADAWQVGLPCGGTLDVLAQPRVPPAVLEAAAAPGASVVATPLGGARADRGSEWVVDGRTAAGAAATGRPARPDRSGAHDAGQRPAVLAAALEALEREESRVVRLPSEGPHVPEIDVFLEVFLRRPTLVVFGGAQVAAALVSLAGRIGFRTVVADGRPAFVGADRFPDADERIAAWPAEAFARVGLDRSTYVCVLSHDPKLDDAALLAALPSAAAYVGAIGSRRSQAARRERLRAAGVGERDLARLRGPIGLDLGGRTPEETALAILAEITAVRRGGTGRPLREARADRVRGLVPIELE
jgi:xanthine dehydrogenase accessory factor